MMKAIVRVVIAVFFLGAGVAHFRDPETFMKIVPPWLPSARTLVYVSGFFEVAGAIGLLLPATRVAAGWGLVVLLLAVFPANIYMATEGIKFGDFPPQDWMSWARLPLQFVLIGLLVWSCELLKRP